MVWPIMGDACRQSIHLKDGVEASQRVRRSGRSAPSSTLAFNEQSGNCSGPEVGFWEIETFHSELADFPGMPVDGHPNEFCLKLALVGRSPDPKPEPCTGGKPNEQKQEILHSKDFQVR